MYLWILIVGGAFSFFASMGIGANDAANAFATSIGSKSLSIKNAVVMAAIFESSGAILMGGHVVNTIRKGIADYECFQEEPYVLMYGCMWVCFSVGSWLFIASKYEMPVSTTHSCVGSMIGMTLALKGPECVIWYEKKESFPYIGGVSGIVLSWIISPLFSAILASLFFGGLRSGLLRLKNSFNMSIYVFPFITGSCVTLNTFYIIYKGAKGLGLNDTPFGIACAWSFGLGGGSGLLSLLLIKKAKVIVENRFKKTESIENVELELSDKKTVASNVEASEEFYNNAVNSSDVVLAIHENAEKFDEKTEELFKFLQIFTAICDSFSHGANDVANAIGPFAAIYTIYNNDILTEKNELGKDAYWILALGGLGISAGLAVYGYKIIKAIGVKMCKITPSRGISIELASALVIITGSRFEIPLSTTHCQVGATIGVALLEDPNKCSGINKIIFAKTLAGWIITLIVVGSTTGLLVSQGAYAPSTSGF
jgi:sodium-dependent phosphate transporter